MPNELILHLQALPSNDGFDILAITAGLAQGHGLNFPSAVLKDSLPLWDNLPCFLDHDFWGQSVNNLAGALHDPSWNEQEQGIQARLIPGGPGAKTLTELRLAAKTDPAILATVGFSAHLSVISHANGDVKQITRVHSADCVISPARGGKFLSSSTIRDTSRIFVDPNLSGEQHMKKIIRRNGQVFEIEDKDLQPGDEVLQLQSLPPGAVLSLSKGNEESETQALLTTQAATRAAESRQAAAAESLRQVRLQTCRTLLKASLDASRLPGPSAARVEARFNAQLDQGEPFEPQSLDLAITEEQTLLSELSAAGVIQGPARISGMHTTTDQLEAAVSDLFGVPRDERLSQVKPARLTGIRELYLMLTGDYDLHGGYYGERIQLATTADFTGLVKNALNKIVAQQWEAIGRAGYSWWEKIVRVEHFTSLNQITGVLVGTVGALPEVAEGGEYTELAIGDSPETASFAKYGGYIPLTLELIDRDDGRKLKAYVSELGSAALRKISALVAAVFTDNSGVGPTMADTGALFNATAVTTAGGHANLLTTAIGADYTAWNAVALAVFNQPLLIKNATGYYGTGPKMGVEPRFCLVPRALKPSADALFIPRWEASAQNVAAVSATWGGRVEPVCVPEWTDVTDWAAVVDPAIAPAIIVGERFGLKPEIYTAGRETDPAVFMNDEHRIKVRMFSAILVQDFRPLHKSNVA